MEHACANLSRIKYAGQRYVVLACDADEIPSQAAVQELRGLRYKQAHTGVSLEMELSYYSFNWTAQHLWHRAFAVSNVGLAGNVTLDDYRSGHIWPSAHAAPRLAVLRSDARRACQGLVAAEASPSGVLSALCAVHAAGLHVATLQGLCL